jgi:hypothetical protein
MDRRSFVKFSLGAVALGAVSGEALGAPGGGRLVQVALGAVYGRDRAVTWDGSVGILDLNTWQRAAMDRRSAERAEGLAEDLGRDPGSPRRLVFQHEVSEVDGWSYFPEFQVRWWRDRVEDGARIMGRGAQVFRDVVVRETPWAVEISAPGGHLPGMGLERARWAARERARWGA